LAALSWLAILGAVLQGLAASTPLAMAQDNRTGSAFVLDVDGAIGPAMADFIVRSIEGAGKSGAQLVILRMDTPGGLDTSMREIIRAILASPVPVVTYVAPSGARAASAGTYILYASHVAAMAPGTNLGAATPVQIGGGGLPFGGGDDDKKDKKPGGDGQDAQDDPETASPQPGNASERKAINDAVAYIRSLAEMRGRNADWAEDSVRLAASLSAEAALDRGVIDLTAANLQKLLAQLDGRIVNVAGQEVRLATGAIAIERIEPDWRTELLAVITNPNIALILMMIGIYGLIFEFLNPGALYPGTIGAICLLLGLYALAALPLDYTGIGLMLLGLVLIVAEAFTPTFGILGIGGTIALALGAAILIDTEQPAFQVSWPVIGAIALMGLAFTLFVVPLAVGAHRRKVVSGREQMIGSTGEVSEWRGNRGYILVHGERWKAVSKAPLRKGQTVRVLSLDGLTLEVEPAADVNQ